jgi:hypothetical protein
VAAHHRPESLKRLEREYCLRQELDPAWAAQPIALGRHGDRTVLVLEDPGGMPLDQLRGQPFGAFPRRRAARRLNVFFVSGYWPFDRDRPLASARHYPQEHQASQCSGKLRHRTAIQRLRNGS